MWMYRGRACSESVADENPLSNLPLSVMLGRHTIRALRCWPAEHGSRR
jgi:hypothetical protein